MAPIQLGEGSLRVGRHLDQIQVGIAEVEGGDRPARAHALHWTLLDLDIAAMKPIQDLVRRSIRGEAEISRSRRRVGCLRVDLLPCLVQVDLLLAEGKSATTL